MASGLLDTGIPSAPMGPAQSQRGTIGMEQVRYWRSCPGPEAESSQQAGAKLVSWGRLVPQAGDMGPLPLLSWLACPKGTHPTGPSPIHMLVQSAKDPPDTGVSQNSGWEDGPHSNTGGNSIHPKLSPVTGFPTPLGPLHKMALIFIVGKDWPY